jgi:DNA mismatch repair protein MutL
MTRKIRILPDVVASRIAAGEVVERPASVLKELLENALDAGALAIAIEIEAGGKTLVRVADDGEGMGREDALLALDRHATSKVRTAEDLVGVPTFGFRGEALPSIASVSRFELETRAEDEPLGTRIAATGGSVSAVEDIARTRGTTVAVRGLFHNTPARRKFLRSARSESRACMDVVRTLALARPGLGLTMLADSRRAFEALPVATLVERAPQVLGAELATTLVPVDWREGDISVTGLVQRPSDAAPAGRTAHLFVNGRPFRDHFLVRAAERGYRATIPAGLRPSMVLVIGVLPAEVDVNVHPAKLEVRFRDRFAVEAAIEEAVHRALGALISAAPMGRRGLPWEHAAAARPGERGDAAPPSDLFAPPHDAAAPPAADQPEALRLDEGLRVVAQVHESYIVVEGEAGLLIIDQHSAHERVLYERAMAALAANDAASQKLLFPLTIALEAAELEALESHRELVERLGYEVEPFGGQSVIVHASPAPHPRFDAQRCLREIAADLAGGRFGGLANRLERFASSFACRAAIKAGQPLSRPEMEELVARLFACALPAHDVHGRPTIVQLPRSELERRFGRR